MWSNPKSSKSIWHCRSSNLDLKIKTLWDTYNSIQNWFEGFLIKGSQFVEINNAQSKTLFNKYDVPQG